VNVEFSDTIQTSIPPELLGRAALHALSFADQGQDGDLTILLTDDQQLQQLNQQFLGIDASTDVLSFPEDYVDPDTGTRYLGDILISYPRSLEQARAGGHPVEAEIQLLVIHGVLHLLGYDHAETGEKDEMWAIQEKILAQLGIDPIGKPE
ncbi:MAG: rRNA maturation RNase YbeY, partial [Omnitrophica WOR_2 bacterium]